MEEYLAEKQRLNLYSRATVRVHGAALREFGVRAEGRSLDAIPPKLARDHYEALQERASETTAQIHVRALRAFFNAHKKIARINPFADLELAKIDQPARVIYCTKPQRETLIKAASNDDLLFILLAGFDAGLRKNEIIEARVFFFDMAGHATHLQNTATLRLKDNEARTIPMTKRFRLFLRRYLKGKQPDDFALKPEVAHGKGTYRYDFHRPFNDFLDAVDDIRNAKGCLPVPNVEPDQRQRQSRLIVCGMFGDVLREFREHLGQREGKVSVEPRRFQMPTKRHHKRDPRASGVIIRFSQPENLRRSLVNHQGRKVGLAGSRSLPKLSANCERRKSFRKVRKRLPFRRVWPCIVPTAHQLENASKTGTSIVRLRQEPSRTTTDQSAHLCGFGDRQNHRRRYPGIE